MNKPYGSGSGSSSLGKRSIFYICIHVFTEDIDSYREWFLLDQTGIVSGRCIIEEKETDEFGKKRNLQFRHPEFRIPSYIPETATFVAVESKIYALGGIKRSGIDPRDRKTVGEVYVYDTLTARDTADWKSLSPMTTPRSYPEVVALDGKLYVMGSNLTNDVWSITGPWSEVYDIHNNRWSVLDDYAPWDRYGHQSHVCVDCVLVVPKDRSITPDDVMVAYFYQTGYTYFYCPRLNQWNRVLLPIEFENTVKESVVAVEQVLFIAAQMYLCAYDLVSDPETAENIETTFATYKCPGFPRPQARMIKGLEGEYPLEEKYPLIDAGGKKFVYLGNMDFCFVWPSVDKDCSGFKTTTIHCLKFHVDKDVWLASVLSHDQYRVQAPLYDEVDWVHLEECVQVIERGESLGDFIGLREHPSSGQWEESIYHYDGPLSD